MVEARGWSRPGPEPSGSAGFPRPHHPLLAAAAVVAWAGPAPAAGPAVVSVRAAQARWAGGRGEAREAEAATAV